MFPATEVSSGIALMVDARKIAQDLLTYIGAPAGTVNVLVRGASARQRLVVWLSPSVRVHESRLPRHFRGLDVIYERRQPARPLKSGTKNQHVLPHGDKWAIKGEGNGRLTSVFNTQGEAVNRAREIARRQKSELLVHGRDGEIRSRDTYGHDPYPPKG